MTNDISVRTQHVQGTLDGIVVQFVPDKGNPRLASAITAREFVPKWLATRTPYRFDRQLDFRGSEDDDPIDDCMRSIGKLKDSCQQAAATVLFVSFEELDGASKKRLERSIIEQLGDGSISSDRRQVGGWTTMPVHAEGF